LGDLDVDQRVLLLWILEKWRVKLWVRLFENRELRRRFGPKREEVARDWRRLYNEELHNLYASPY
jgi:hypothetical protein